MLLPGAIGIFDSGYGGLTVLKEIRQNLPEYDYIYLGDNARTPYGTRSFDTVYKFTLEGVKILFEQGCHLVILACNTASAKALRTIQQIDLPKIDPQRRVLGVLRPTTEMIGNVTKTKHIGIMGTTGTIKSESYPTEIKKFFPDVKVFQQACPLWVPLVENNEYASDGADFFVKKDIQQLFNQSSSIDTVILGCTHYPLLLEKIQKYIPDNVHVISQGPIIADRLRDYLNRHPDIESKCSKSSKVTFLTTDSTLIFDKQASIFYGEEVQSLQI